MRGGLLRSWSGLAVVVMLGACSNIIGISSYEVDPALDEGAGATSSSGGDTSNGGKATNGGKGPTGGKTWVMDGGAPAGGDDTGMGGMAPGGTPAIGGKATGGSSSAGAPPGGEGGMGGDPTPGGCASAKDCDDTIDCTTDTCNSAGVCVHTPKDTLCDATQCEACQAGIGCVAGPKTVMQLLSAPDFDTVGDWDESTSEAANIVTAAGAQSGTKVAKFGPAAVNAKKQQYSDLLQYMTFPEGMVSLTVTGYYKLTVGTKLPADDYLVIALYEDGAIDPFTQFHSFEATAGAQTAWKAFTYNAPKSDVLQLAGTDQMYTFDLVAHLWDTVFQFDSLQLNATVCQ